MKIAGLETLRFVWADVLERPECAGPALLSTRGAPRAAQYERRPASGALGLRGGLAALAARRLLLGRGAALARALALLAAARRLAALLGRVRVVRDRGRALLAHALLAQALVLLVVFDPG